MSTTRTRPIRYWKLLALLLSLLAVVAAGCGNDDDGGASPATEEPEVEATEAPEPEDTEAPEATEAPEPEPEATDAPEPEDDGDNIGDTTITLAVNPWAGSEINVSVAAQLLENELGYTVEREEIDENAQWASINTGGISASLEVWPSGHGVNIVDFIENPDGNVDNGGLLGPIGGIGWYVPTYMVDQYPALATWEGFADPELASLFATAETGSNAQFLSGDPSWTIYEEQIIENLDLPIEVVYVGSEAGILAAVDAAYSREDPVLFYLWTPHVAFGDYDLTRVALPEYSDECYATGEAGGVDCDYPVDALFKIINSDLAEASPAAYAFLSAMNYTTGDQVSILSAVENDGLSIDEAAAQWIENNPDTWGAWIPA